MANALVSRVLSSRTIRQFLKFCVVGAASTAIDWGIHRLLYKGFGGELADTVNRWVLATFPSLQHPDFDGAYTVFKVVSFLFAALNGFLWNRLWTFRIRGEEERFRQLGKFYIVTGTGMIINALIGSRIHKPDAGEWNYYFSLAAATAAVMTWNFMGHKFWTFRVKKEA